MHSITAVLFELGLPSFNTLVIVYNSRVIYGTQIANSTSDILMHFRLLVFLVLVSFFCINVLYVFYSFLLLFFILFIYFFLSFFNCSMFCVVFLWALVA